MVKTAFHYRITYEARATPPRYRVSKLDNDLEVHAVYDVFMERRTTGREEEEFVYICGCPAYKPLCKHVHWVKAFRLRTKGRNDVSCAYFDPALNKMRLVTEEEATQDIGG